MHNTCKFIGSVIVLQLLGTEGQSHSGNMLRRSLLWNRNAGFATDRDLLLTWLHKVLVRNKAGKGPCLEELVVRMKKRQMLKCSRAADNTQMWLWSGEWNAGQI